MLKSKLTSAEEENEQLREQLDAALKQMANAPAASVPQGLQDRRRLELPTLQFFRARVRSEDEPTDDFLTLSPCSIHGLPSSTFSDGPTSSDGISAPMKFKSFQRECAALRQHADQDGEDQEEEQDEEEAADGKEEQGGMVKWLAHMRTLTQDDEELLARQQEREALRSENTLLEAKCDECRLTDDALSMQVAMEPAKLSEAWEEVGSPSSSSESDLTQPESEHAWPSFTLTK